MTFDIKGMAWNEITEYRTNQLELYSLRNKGWFVPETSPTSSESLGY